MKKLNELHEEILTDLDFTESMMVSEFVQVLTAVNADMTLNGAAAMLHDGSILVMCYTDRGIVSQIVKGLTIDEMINKLKESGILVKRHY